MRFGKIIRTALAVLLLAGAALPAQADETDCKAIITTLAGDKLQVTNFAVRMMEAAFPGTQLLVFYDDGQSILDLGRMRRLSRLAPPGVAQEGQKVEFAFVANDGQTGKFKIWAEYIFSGQIALGAWSERAGRIKQIEVSCPPPDLTPPASTD